MLSHRSVSLVLISSYEHNKLYRLDGRLFSESSECASALITRTNSAMGELEQIFRGYTRVYRQQPLLTSTYQEVFQRALVPLSRRPVDLRHGDMRPLAATASCPRPWHPPLDDQAAEVAEDVGRLHGLVE